MKHRSNPAWSFGTKTQAEPFQTNKFSPPPDSYNIRPEEILVPTTEFGRGPRGNLFARDDGPGPGDYNIPHFLDGMRPKTNDRRRMRRDVKSAQNRQENKTQTVGPGSYQPEKPKQNISYSMGNRTFGGQKGVNELGPGQYNARPVTVSKSYRIGKGNRRGLYDLNNQPGPGAYDNKPTTAPAPVFGKAARAGRTGTEEVPAPWSYNIPDFQTELKNKPGKTMISRRPQISNKTEIPGPGAYNPPSKQQAGKFYSIGTGNRSSFIQSKDNPAPWDHQPSYSTKNARSSGFGKGGRPPLTANSSTPGPGAYEIQNTIGSGRKYGITGRRGNQRNLMNNPGPGAYETNPEVNSRTAPAYRIGTASRSNENRLKHKTTPGPGAHNLHGKCHCGNEMWTFGKDLRTRDKDDGEPGPGYYDIPPTVPDVPPYLLKNKKETLFS